MIEEVTTDAPSLDCEFDAVSVESIERIDDGDGLHSVQVKLYDGSDYQFGPWTESDAIRFHDKFQQVHYEKFHFGGREARINAGIVYRDALYHLAYPGQI